MLVAPNGQQQTPSYTQQPSQTGNRAPATPDNSFLPGDQPAQQQQQTQNPFGSDGKPQQQFQMPAAPTFNPQVFTGSAGAIYHPGTLPTTDLGTYDPHLLNLDPTNQLQQSVLTNVLNSGGSLNDDVVAKMQAQLKDQALTMQQGNDTSMMQNFANRGYSNGPQEQALLAQSGLGTQSNLLNQYRDLGVQAAQTNRNDILNALGMSNTIQTGQTQNNATQEGLRQAGVQSQNAKTQFALQRALDQEQLNQAGAASQAQADALNAQAIAAANAQQLQNMLGMTGYGLGYSQLNNNIQQNALNNVLGLTQ